LFIFTTPIHTLVFAPVYSQTRAVGQWRIHAEQRRSLKQRAASFCRSDELHAFRKWSVSADAEKARLTSLEAKARRALSGGVLKAINTWRPMGAKHRY